MSLFFFLGVVYVARLCDNNMPIAIKKVLQDKRYKNRELQIMRKLNHQVIFLIGTNCNCLYKYI